ncbi:hypothetical protein [Xylocopilactobacillus apicola]|uniref:Fungal lipase-like domain-containing protein n=1 Tax=Xylocopilactobacillus apicola TaxID=2932184 RepID=A0AAU9DEV8_9LACO|nr:hypothetical protein [Xylocopilactobacillus apicola]BDR59432.1 hypothetical protein XA3_18730 [Xylocopilactobacillus apicola]
MYRGSSVDFSSIPKGYDTVLDWLLADGPAALAIRRSLIKPGKPSMTKFMGNLVNEHIGLSELIPQFRSASSTLQEALKKYPNAKVTVYGHSLGSMNGQYALASLSIDQLKRINGGYLYEGPNIYSILNKDKRAIAGLLRNYNVHNYTDWWDAVSLGFGVNFKEIVGSVEYVSTKWTGSIGEQHSWGGYIFGKDGKLEIMVESLKPMYGFLSRFMKKLVVKVVNPKRLC